MEWLWEIIDRLQKSDVFSALQSLQPIDWVFIFVLLGGLAQGSRKGFSDMFGKLLGLFLVSMLVLSFYEYFATFMSARMPSLSLAAAKPFAFFLLTIFLWLSVSWCINVVGKIFKVEAQGLLKTLGGMVLGGMRMMLMLSFAAQFLLFLPMDVVQRTFEKGHNYTGYVIARFVPELHERIIIPLFEKTRKKKSLVPHKIGGQA